MGRGGGQTRLGRNRLVLVTNSHHELWNMVYGMEQKLLARSP